MRHWGPPSRAPICNQVLRIAILRTLKDIGVMYSQPDNNDIVSRHVEDNPKLGWPMPKGLQGYSNHAMILQERYEGHF